MNTYTPDDTNNPTSFTEPDDGDNENVASVLPFLNGLADKAAHMNLPEQDSAERYKVAAQAFVVVQSTKPFFNPADWTETWVPILIDQGLSGSLLWHPIRIPDGSECTAVSVYVTPAGGHGVVPASPPEVTFSKLERSTGTITDIDTKVDDSADVTAYELRHVIALIGLTEVIDNTTYQYAIRFASEASTGALAGLKYEATPGAVVHITSLDPGAS